MSVTPRQWGLAAAGGLLLGLVSVHFGCQCAAGFARLKGERAYQRGDFKAAWRSYGEALRFGGLRERLESDQAETLLFALDQQALGVKVELPLDRDDAVSTLRSLLARRLSEAPYRAYSWSLVSDLYLYEGREARRATPLDLSALSDDPLKNLLPQEGLAMAALEEATRREPTNYVYQDLMAEQYLEWGLVDEAAAHVRKAVAAYPLHLAHIYLSRTPLPSELLEAALGGFEDALRVESMLPKEVAECDAGWLLLRQGDSARAVPYFKRSLARAPTYPDALYRLGEAAYMMGDYRQAEEALARAAPALRDTASLFYYLGLARLKQDKKSEAIEALRTAREIDPHAIEYFHALGQVLESDGAVKEAERQFMAAANLNPDRMEAWSALLAFYGRHTDLHSGARRACGHLEGLKIDPAVYKAPCDRLLRGEP